MSARAEGTGWRMAAVNDVPPVKPDWPPTWKSIRHHFGITAFWRVGAQLVEMRIQGTVARCCQASVGLPHAHQGADEVSAAAPGLEGVVGVAGAQPHRDAIAEPDLLGAPPGAIHADRAHGA